LLLPTLFALRANAGTTSQPAKGERSAAKRLGSVWRWSQARLTLAVVLFFCLGPAGIKQIKKIKGNRRAEERMASKGRKMQMGSCGG